MNKTIVAALLVLTTPFAFAQLPEGVQRSSSPQGMQIQGSAPIQATGQSTGTVAASKESAARNTAGAVKESVQIQGTTRINAIGINTNSVAVGKGNQADNKVGTIGGQ